MNNNKFKYTALSAAIVVALSACGGSDNNNNSSAQELDHAPQAGVTQLENVKHWQTISGSIQASDADSDNLSITIFDGETEISPVDNVYTFPHGILTLKSLTAFDYLPISGEAATIKYTVTAKGKSANGSIEIPASLTDPLAYQQWHLNNTGQKAYALSDAMKKGLVDLYVGRGIMTEEQAIEYWNSEFADAESNILVAGEDMNVPAAFAQGVTGEGVTAVVVDSGLEIRHEDLAPNVLPNRSLNLLDNALDKTDPTSTATNGDHGTSVAGLIASKGWNGLGGRGVSPDTGLIGMNLLASGDKTPKQDLLVHGFPGSGITESESISVFNRSYGLTYPVQFSYSELDEAIESYPNRKLRSGKGATNVKSSGNSFVSEDLEGSFCDDNGANDLGLTCYNSNSESSQGHPYYFSIGAVNSNGKHTSYSSAGANLLAAAPAGEYGRWAPAMVTTDPMTCLSGSSGYTGRAIASWTGAYGEEFAASQYPFDYPGHPENPNCNYRSTMNGTSSAAPNASGVISLILSANSELTWRDVRHIIVSTSTKNDAENAPVTVPVGAGEFIAHDGWVENAAGYSHNNLYGFGRVDAGAAVKMAKSYSTKLGEEVITDWIGQGSVMGQDSLEMAIPDNSEVGATYKVTVSEDINVEAIQFKLDVFNDEFGMGIQNDEAVIQSTAGSDLAIEVISPSGTRSVLLSSRQALIRPAYDFSGAGFQIGYILKNGVFLSNSFYGESAKGEWTIRLFDVSNKSFATTSTGDIVYDGYVNNSTPSKLMGAAVRIFGHQSAE
ncbi:S8 family serine peptidase [Pseudoalteromonas sp. L23]|uniref:S8 family serine peptidase n=1 Tax=unclassified Pseudoalteromonas TaxID=194690 RepID=UPI001EF0D515|nr:MULTISPECIES: S8 family serine peptidase [unclassified Pseudoalteromonas]MCF7515067.1 S8 family serine peptidase [Pseudoalteromonas sp. L7]MCF7527009.1 S8 family serine peptidase [Pseudoalteromonas sp. L23]MCX2767417.1 S8 family serine peptidase [Pseudoalteromonas sp. B530]